MSTPETNSPTPTPPSDGTPSDGTTPDPTLLVRLAQAVEAEERLDPVVHALRPWARTLVDGPVRRWLLLGRPLGHALHPVLTDAPLGLWMSASSLDLLAGAEARPAARRLVGLDRKSVV